MHSRIRVLRIAGLVALTASVATWIWPTRYRAVALARPVPHVLAVRQDRFTGAVDVLTSAGWHRLGVRRASTGQPTASGPATMDTTTPYDPLDDYRPDWRGTASTPDTTLRPNIARP